MEKLRDYNKIRDIFDNLGFFPCSNPIIKDLKRINLLEQELGCFNEFCYGVIHCLAFGLIQHGLLSEKTPDYFVEIMRNFDKNEGNDDIMERFKGFMILLWELKEKNNGNKGFVSKKIKDLFNKIEEFSFGAIYFIKGFFECYKGDWDIYKENPLEIVKFIDAYVDFTINIDFSQRKEGYLLYFGLKNENTTKIRKNKELDDKLGTFNYIIYAKNYSKRYFPDFFNENPLEEHVSPLKKQLSLTKNVEISQFSLIKSKSIIKTKKNDSFFIENERNQCQNDNCKEIMQENEEFFINLVCFHLFCYNCIKNIENNEEKPFCLKNYCFLPLQPVKRAHFLLKTKENLKISLIPQENKVLNKENPLIFIEKNDPPLKKCQNPECKTQNPSRFFINESSCNHIFCEICILLISKRGFICLKNYCFERLNEEKIKLFVKSDINIKFKGSFAMKSNNWLVKTLEECKNNIITPEKSY